MYVGLRGPKTHVPEQFFAVSQRRSGGLRWLPQTRAGLRPCSRRGVSVEEVPNVPEPFLQVIGGHHCRWLTGAGANWCRPDRPLAESDSGEADNVVEHKAS